MKITLLPLLFFCLVFKANAQYPKLIVQLKDKGNNTFSFSNPAQYLSARAIERRTRYNIPFDSTDVPVSQKYLNDIKNVGAVTILSTSKWLNQVLIETTDQKAIQKIETLPFVKSTKGIGYRSTSLPLDEKLREPITSLRNASANRSAAIDTYNYGNSYGQVHIHEGEFLHNKGFHGETMQIAVLDAGFLQYKTNSAFDSARMNGQILGERDLVAFDNSVNEDDSHGMQCLSTLVANWPGKMVGTAPKASYWLIRTENAASEYPIEEYNWVVGAEFADSSGCDVVSSSLGYYTFDDPTFNHSYADFYKNTTSVSQGAALAARKGMIVSVIAGNEGNDLWKYIAFPADADSVCSVGGVNSAEVIADFSSYGYPGKVKPNIVSVGVATVIAGVNNQPVTGNGTSYANPNVAGLIACLWQAFPKVNNMKILEAVYKSADKFNNPDNRYGYGIPNFRVAYQLLKHDENMGLYGNDWLFATPTPFTTGIAVKFIGRMDGNATITLLNSAGQMVASQAFVTEKEEVYNYTFINLGNLPAGIYSIRYADGTNTRSITIQKGDVFAKDWLNVQPNPFSDDVTVYIKGQETGEISLRLIDTKGSVVATAHTQLTQNETNTVHFNSLNKLPTGVYFLQYLGKSFKRTIRLFKE